MHVLVVGYHIFQPGIVVAATHQRDNLDMATLVYLLIEVGKIGIGLARHLFINQHLVFSRAV